MMVKTWTPQIRTVEHPGGPGHFSQFVPASPAAAARLQQQKIDLKRRLTNASLTWTKMPVTLRTYRPLMIFHQKFTKLGQASESILHKKS